ncbi:hypothetical protein CHCC20347_2322 [Bacillus paralicheniformis]|nr:hypothetical protein CHCC20347_2322 [Bacillus paralicheniformis]
MLCFIFSLSPFRSHLTKRGMVLSPCPKQKTRFIEKAGLFYRQVK